MFGNLIFLRSKKSITKSFKALGYKRFMVSIFSRPQILFAIIKVAQARD